MTSEPANELTTPSEKPANEYGIVVDGESYDFEEWSWDYEMPDNIVDLISRAAAKIVLKELIKEARIALSEVNETPIIEFSSFDGDIVFVYPLASALNDWIETNLEPDYPATANHLLVVLEQAITNIRAELVPDPEEG